MCFNHYCALYIFSKERHCALILNIKYSLFTVKQLDACDQSLMAGMPERVSSTISRVEGTTWNAQRYQITAVGEGQAAKQGSVGG